MQAFLQLVPQITTPLALIAFLAAAVVMMHARAVGRAERLIRTAPVKDRGTLVAGALEILNVDASKLSKDQLFELSLEVLAQRRHRNYMIFGASLLLALIFAGLTIYGITRPDLQGDVERLLSEGNRRTVMPLLNQSGVFEAVDAGVVSHLATLSELPRSARAAMSELEADVAAQLRYDSIASVRELRRRAERREEPFVMLGEQVTASVPDRVDHPHQFFAHVPMDSKFRDRLVLVTSVGTGRYLRLFARGVIDPAHGQTRLHLNREQAAYLEGAFPVTGRLDVTIKETGQAVYDPNCSVDGRSPQFIPRTRELCSQGESVTLAFLQTFMAR